MKLKTIWKNFFLKKEPRELADIWLAYESGQKVSKDEMRQIIEKLKEININCVNKIQEQQSYINEMQHGFDYSQNRLIQKINSQ